LGSETSQMSRRMKTSQNGTCHFPGPKERERGKTTAGTQEARGKYEKSESIKLTSDLTGRRDADWKRGRARGTMEGHSSGER